MKSKLLILSLFISLCSFGQKLPVTGLCLSNVVAVTGGTCLSQAFTNANSAYFDPAYAVSGNCLADFRNYGAGATCTRPSGLTNVATYHTLTVDGVTASFSGSFAAASQALYVYINSTDPARSMSGYNSQLFAPASIGDSVYVTFGTDCAKVVDGYYLYLPNQPVFPDYVYRIQSGVITEKTMASYTPPTVPYVTTYWYSADLTSTTAHAGGLIDSDGGSPVAARGVCWGTSVNPTTSGSHTTDGTGTGLYHSYITGLTQNTTYYLRAYATNSVGTNYGGESSFTTHQSIFTPTVSTDNGCFIDVDNAFIEATVSSDGGATVTTRGFCWSTSNATPTTGDSVHAVGDGTGYFSWSPNSLPQNTNIYIRAYATNSVGTSYGTIFSINSNNLCN